MGSNARFFVGGNWKCNGTREFIAKLCTDLSRSNLPKDIDIVCAPPFVYLMQAQIGLVLPYQLAAQNCLVGPGGAYTGEISAEMLVDIEIPWVILGHSERRRLYGETNE